MLVVHFRNWHALAIRGIAGILFGLGAFLWPQVTLGTLVLLFGAYALVDGIAMIAASARRETPEHAWLLPLEGLLGIAIGLAAFAWTGATLRAIVVLIGLWAIVTGVLEIMASLRLRREIPGEGLLGLAGFTSLLLGILTLLSPGAGTMVLVVLLGSYGLLFGSALLFLALRVRRMAPHASRGRQRHRTA